jgi:hypothetical protein
MATGGPIKFIEVDCKIIEKHHVKYGWKSNQLMNQLLKSNQLMNQYARN